MENKTELMKVNKNGIPEILKAAFLVNILIIPGLGQEKARKIKLMGPDGSPLPGVSLWAVEKGRRFFTPDVSGEKIAESDRKGQVSVQEIPTKGKNLVFLKSGVCPRFFTPEELIEKKILIENKIVEFTEGFEGKFLCIDEKGSPIEGVKVTLSQVPFIPKGTANLKERWKPAGGERFAVYSGNSNSKGEVSLENIPFGKYVIRAWHPFFVLSKGLEESEIISENNKKLRRLVFTRPFVGGLVSRSSRFLNFEKFKMEKGTGGFGWQSLPSLIYIKNRFSMDSGKKFVVIGSFPGKAPCWVYLEKSGFHKVQVYLEPLSEKTQLKPVESVEAKEKSNGYREVVFSGLSGKPGIKVHNLEIIGYQKGSPIWTSPIEVMLNTPVCLATGRYVLRVRGGAGNLKMNPFRFYVSPGNGKLFIRLRFIKKPVSVCMGIDLGWKDCFCLARMRVIGESGGNIYLSGWDGTPLQFLLNGEAFKFKGFIYGLKRFGGECFLDGLSSLGVVFSPD